MEKKKNFSDNLYAEKSTSAKKFTLHGWIWSEREYLITAFLMKFHGGLDHLVTWPWRRVAVPRVTERDESSKVSLLSLPTIVVLD